MLASCTPPRVRLPSNHSTSLSLRVCLSTTFLRHAVLTFRPLYLSLSLSATFLRPAVLTCRPLSLSKPPLGVDSGLWMPFSLLKGGGGRPYPRLSLSYPVCHLPLSPFLPARAAAPAAAAAARCRRRVVDTPCQSDGGDVLGGCRCPMSPGSRRVGQPLAAWWYVAICQHTAILVW